MKLVKFENGKYGVRLNWFFSRRFLDLNGGQVWSIKEYIIKYCMGTEQEARAAMKNYSVKYTIIKD